MTQSEDFQYAAHVMACRAADRLREAAAKLDGAYTDAALPSDTMNAIEAARAGVINAMSCLGHASHQHALAVLHREREKNGAPNEG